MGKVKVKDLAPGPNRKLKVWSTLINLGINVQTVKDAYGGYFILGADQIIEKVTENAQEFRKNNFEVLDPPELKAKRTIVLTGVCEHIPDYNDQQIKDEVTNANPTIRATEVIRIPRNTSILKLKLENVSMVSHSLLMGLSLFSQHFSENHIAQDFYANIPQCMKCYSYAHTSRNCEKEDGYLVCSVCSEEGHRYKDCKTKTAKCISCQGNHATLASRCPTRKEKTKELAKEKRAQSQHRGAPREGVSYAAAATNNPVPPSILPQASAAWVAPPMKQTAIINTALIYSNMREAARPGVFQHTFNRIMEANGLPTVIIPEDVLDAEAIQQNLSGNSPTNEMETTTSDEESRKRARESIDSSQNQEETEEALPLDYPDEPEPSTSGQENTSAPASVTKGKETKKKKARTAASLGLQIFAPMHEFIPRNVTHDKLRTMVLNNEVNVKYVFTADVPEDEVLEAITSNEIDLTQAPIHKIHASRIQNIHQGYRSLKKQ